MDEPGDHIHVPGWLRALDNEREVAEVCRSDAWRPPTICAHSSISKPDSRGSCHADRRLLYSGWPLHALTKRSSSPCTCFASATRTCTSDCKTKNWRGYDDISFCTES